MRTPQEVMARLEEVEEQMATNQNALETAAMDYSAYKREVDVAKAKTFQTAEGSVQSREAQALIAVSASDLWQVFVSAEAAYESLKLAQRSLSDRGSIGQSLLRAQAAA